MVEGKTEERLCDLYSFSKLENDSQAEFHLPRDTGRPGHHAEARRIVDVQSRIGRLDSRSCVPRLRNNWAGNRNPVTIEEIHAGI
jgi:hypothetical protein